MSHKEQVGLTAVLPPALNHRPPRLRLSHTTQTEREPNTVSVCGWCGTTRESNRRQGEERWGGTRERGTESHSQTEGGRELRTDRQGKRGQSCVPAPLPAIALWATTLHMEPSIEAGPASPHCPQPRRRATGKHKGQLEYKAEFAFLSFPTCLGHKNASLVGWEKNEGTQFLVAGGRAGLTLQTNGGPPLLWAPSCPSVPHPGPGLAASPVCLSVCLQARHWKLRG